MIVGTSTRLPAPGLPLPKFLGLGTSGYWTSHSHEQFSFCRSTCLHFALKTPELGNET